MWSQARRHMVGGSMNKKTHYLGAVYDLTQENFQHVIQQLDEALAENEKDRVRCQVLVSKYKNDLEAERARSQKLLEVVKRIERFYPYDADYGAREAIEAYNKSGETR